MLRVKKYHHNRRWDTKILWTGSLATREQILSGLQSYEVYHSQFISCLGFIMTMVIVISFARDRKTAPNDYAAELLTRIVQRPTKLNDKI